MNYISIEDAKKIIDEKRGEENFVILDVRTQNEFKNGHIEGAENFDIYSPNFFDFLAGLDKNKIYLVYCHTGNRSSAASQAMAEAGFREVYDLEEGLNGWEAVGYPVMR